MIEIPHGLNDDAAVEFFNSKIKSNDNESEHVYADYLMFRLLEETHPKLISILREREWWYA